MKPEHLEHEVLIDLVDGGLPPDVAAWARSHLQGCPECRAYVSSLERVFALADKDVVPEQPDAYWAGFSKAVRARLRSRQAPGGQLREPPGVCSHSPSRQSIGQRLRARLHTALRPAVARSSRGRIALVVSPALALALVMVFALTRPEGPERLADRIEPQLDQMTGGEMADAISEDVLIDDMLIEAADKEISAIEEYLLETEGVDRMIYDLTDDEIEELAATLADLMKNEGTHILRRQATENLSWHSPDGKGC